MKCHVALWFTLFCSHLASKHFGIPPLFLDVIFPWIKHSTWNQMQSSQKPVGHFTETVSMFFYNRVLPIRPHSSSYWAKWGARKHVASRAWIQSLFNQSPFPLINEWLQEAAYQVAEPIDWRTFGVVKSVSLITVNLPSLSTFTTLKQTAQRKGLFLFRTQFAYLVKGTRTLKEIINLKPKL